MVDCHFCVLLGVVFAHVFSLSLPFMFFRVFKHKMNKAVDVPAINKMMAEFERENAKSDMMQELMGDAIDDALADDNNEEEEDRIVSQVLDEIGVSFGEEIPGAPMLGLASGKASMESAPSGKVAEAAGGDPALNELEARLNNLKR
jgi:charged multivesicular body protein 2A